MSTIFKGDIRMLCPKCNQPIKSNRNFTNSCEICGYNALSESYTQNYCYKCKRGNPKDSQICIYCGFDQIKKDYTNKCIACGVSIVIKAKCCDDCMEKVTNVEKAISSILSHNELLADELINRSQFIEIVLRIIKNDIDEKLLKSDIKYYLKSFKKLISRNFLLDNEYKEVSELLLSKYSKDIDKKDKK
jgi:hypothetical protein